MENFLAFLKELLNVKSARSVWADFSVIYEVMVLDAL